MGIAFDFEGSEGQASTPMDTAFGYLSQCAIWNPDTKSESIVIATNGKYNVASDASDLGTTVKGDFESLGFAQFRAHGSDFKHDESSGMARDVFNSNEDSLYGDIKLLYQTMIRPYTKRMFFSEGRNPDSWLGAKAVLDYEVGTVEKVARSNQGEEVDGKRNSNMYDPDRRIQSEDAVPLRGGLFYFHRSEVVIAYDMLYLTQELDECQHILTNALEIIRTAPPREGLIGFGLFRSEGDGEGMLKFKARPNTLLRFGDRTLLRSNETTFDMPNRKFKEMAYWGYLLGFALFIWRHQIDISNIRTVDAAFGRLIGKYKKKGNSMTLDDYVAFTQTLLYGLVGTGEQDLTRNWNAQDIMSTLIHVFGLNYSLANRAMWDLENKDNWRRYQFFCYTLGFVMSRSKAYVRRLQLVTVRIGDRATADRMNNANHGHFEGFGSLGGLHFLTPSNTFIDRVDGGSTLPIPCSVDQDVGRNESVSKMGELANYYERPLKDRNPSGFKPLTIINGEIPPNSIDDNATIQSRYSMKSQNDARIMEVTLPMRSVIKYRFPRHGMIPVKKGSDEESKNDRDKRQILALVGLLANGDKQLSEGYIISSSMQVFKPITVRYFKNRFGELQVSKEKKEGRGKVQEPSGTSGLTGGKVDSKTTRSQEQVPPPAYDPPTPPIIVDPEASPAEDPKLKDAGKVGNKRLKDSDAET